MTSARRLVMVVLPVIVIVGGFWHFLLAPTRAKTAAVQTQVDQATASLDAARATAGVAQQARARYPQDYTALKRLAEAVPIDEDVAALVHGLDAVARANDIDFRAIQIAPPPADAAPATAVPAAPAGDAAGKADAATAKSGAAKGDAAAPPAPAASTDATVPAQAPAGATVGSAGLVTMPFTFTADGAYLAMQRFLKALHGRAKHAHGQISVNGRLLTLDGFSLAAGRHGFPKVKALVSATAYLEPDPGGVIAGSTRRAPAPATAPVTTPAQPLAPEAP
jgi:hypothetical protein